ncbi:hypothetical protein JXL21_00940 [Candidatus Bathyarchaeota archaeon]|nr:hypothetical protein [Candidatus Bathyarchaeota archaeon]
MEKVNSVTKIIGEMLKTLITYLSKMGPMGQKVLALALATGLTGGYAASSFAYDSSRRGYQDDISELMDSLDAMESEIAELMQNNTGTQDKMRRMMEDLEDKSSELSDCHEGSLQLESQVGSLEGEVQDLESNVTIYNEFIGQASDADFLGMYIIDIECDAENGKMKVTLGNSLPINSIIASLSIRKGDEIYTDTSENATGYVFGSMEETSKVFVWDEHEAGAPEGFLNTYSAHLVGATTMRGYSDWVYYVRVTMGIKVTDWDFPENRLVLRPENTGGAYPIFPVAAMIGIKRKNFDGVYYNISEPTIVEEGTLGGHWYEWSESSAGAPDGFLKRNAKYVIRFTFYPSTYDWRLDREYVEATVNSPESSGSSEPPEEY